MSLNVIVSFDSEKALAHWGMLTHEKEINSRSRILIEKLIVVEGVSEFLAVYGIPTFFTTREEPASGPSSEPRDSAMISRVLTALKIV